MRALIKPAIVETHFSLDESDLIVFELERVDVTADQKQPAFSGVDVRVHAVEEVLIDHEGADRGGGLAIIGDIDGIDRSMPPKWRVASL